MNLFITKYVRKNLLTETENLTYHIYVHENAPSFSAKYQQILYQISSDGSTKDIHTFYFYLSPTTIKATLKE